MMSMKRWNVAAAQAIGCCLLMLPVAATAQGMGNMGGMGQGDGKKLPSPPATATVTLAGKTLTVKYNAPSLRGRHLGGPEIVPYGKVWRTGANPATTFITAANLKIGNLSVPAGTCTRCPARAMPGC